MSGDFFTASEDKWCGYCDYLPVCLGEQEKVRETLVQVIAHS